MTIQTIKYDLPFALTLVHTKGIEFIFSNSDLYILIKQREECLYILQCEFFVINVPVRLYIMQYSVIMFLFLSFILDSILQVIFTVAENLLTIHKFAITKYASTIAQWNLWITQNMLWWYFITLFSKLNCKSSCCVLFSEIQWKWVLCVLNRRKWNMSFPGRRL